MSFFTMCYSVFILSFMLPTGIGSNAIDYDLNSSKHDFLGMNHTTNDSQDHHEVRYHVFSINIEAVASPYMIGMVILLASLVKIGFHLYNKLSSIFPESCMLIILGVVVGGILYATSINASDYTLSADTFFYYLLPPIVLEAGYFMPNRAFFDNIGTILLFAVIGTVFNTLTIGSSLYGLSMSGSWMNLETNVSFVHCQIFSSLISAVDPVAVLAVFEEIHVNEILHIIIFGESLLNDAVTVVLYHMFEQYDHIGEENIETIDVFAGVASFCIVGIGGTLIGVLFGLATAFITKYTDHVRVIEPLFVFVMSYLSYLTAEIFHFSGIMAITFCGITMKNYVEHNISQKSHTTIKYFMKMMSSVSETIIFMFLGTSTVVDTHVWNISFIIFTLLFCLIYRAIGVIMLSWLSNKTRLVKLSKVDQFVMAYGGLRGAIAFSLVSLLSKDIPARSMFMTTTLIVVFFTVFIQGTTIKPLVNVLKVKKQEKTKPTMNEHIHERLMDHIMAGVEDITGFHGHHWMRDKFEYYDTRYLKRYLLRERLKTREHGMFRVHSRLSMKDAMDHIARHGSFANLNNVRTEASLANIIRNWSHNSLEMGSHHSEQNEVEKPERNGTVIDMQAVEAHYCKKMADDSKIHHILNDSMIKPRKRWTKHRKHQLHDIENHPPFHHHVRHHLRHLISQKARNHTQKSKDNRNGRKKTSFHKNVSFADDLNDHEEKASKRPHFAVVTEEKNSSDSDSDEFITFTAKDSSVGFDNVFESTDDDHPDGLAESGHLLPPRTPTVAELTLPWKRNTGRPAISSSFTHLFPDDEKPSLSECPSWADNPDYTSAPSPDIAPKIQESLDVPTLPWRRSGSHDNEKPIRSPSASHEHVVFEGHDPNRSSTVSFHLSDSDNHAAETHHMEPVIAMAPLMDFDEVKKQDNVDEKSVEFERQNPRDMINKWLEQNEEIDSLYVDIPGIELEMTQNDKHQEQNKSESVV